MPLTELAIKALKPKQKPFRIADGGGLCLEVTPTGGKLWRWRYYYHGKPQMLSIGKYPSVSLAAARRARDEARDKLAAGKHPGREKKAQKLRAMNEGLNTFRRVALKWHEQRDGRLNKKYHLQNLDRLEQLVFPDIGDLPISELTIPDIVAVVERIAARGTLETAKRMKQLIGQIFRYAAQRGLCLHNPAADLRGIIPTTEEKHHDGVAALSRNGGNVEQQSIARNFFDLADADEVLPELDMRIRAVPAYTYANIHRVNNLFLGGKLVINHAKWRKKISEEVTLFDAGSGQDTTSFLDAFYAGIDKTYRPAAKDTGVASAGASPAAAPKPDAHVPQAPLKIDRRLETVETVACWLDAVTDCGFYRPSAGGVVDHVLRPLRTVRMWFNLKRLRY